jgi:hypothetical protein
MSRVVDATGFVYPIGFIVETDARSVPSQPRTSLRLSICHAKSRSKFVYAPVSRTQIHTLIRLAGDDLCRVAGQLCSSTLPENHSDSGAPAHAAAGTRNLSQLPARIKEHGGNSVVEDEAVRK